MITTSATCECIQTSLNVVVLAKHESPCRVSVQPRQMPSSPARRGQAASVANASSTLYRTAVMSVPSTMVASAASVAISARRAASARALGTVQPQAYSAISAVSTSNRSCGTRHTSMLSCCCPQHCLPLACIENMHGICASTYGVCTQGTWWVAVVAKSAVEKNMVPHRIPLHVHMHDRYC